MILQDIYKCSVNMEKKKKMKVLRHNDEFSCWLGSRICQMHLWNKGDTCLLMSLIFSAIEKQTLICLFEDHTKSSPFCFLFFFFLSKTDLHLTFLNLMQSRPQRPPPHFDAVAK